MLSLGENSQSNELYKTELKMNCRCLIFIWEANNMFMVTTASVDDEMIKFLQIKIP